MMARRPDRASWQNMICSCPPWPAVPQADAAVSRGAGVAGLPLIPRGGALTAALREVREDVCHGGNPFPVR